MAAHKNILKPGSGDPIVSAKMLDIVLGCWWMTKMIPGERGEGKMFASPNNAITAWNFGAVDFRAKIRVLGTDQEKYKEYKGNVFETTVGRLLFNSVPPSDYPYINKEIERKSMVALVDDLITRYGIAEVPALLDRIKTFGFKYATYSGITWGIDDVAVPAGKQSVIEKAKKKSEEVFAHWRAGLLSEDERLRKNIEIWHAAKNEVEKLIPGSLDKNGSVYDMVYSGARGSFSQITQMAGMKGLIQNTAGETIEFPILSCMKEGLTPIEYFITTHGSRKGLTDTALNTAKAGYLTRKLFVVAQDVIITEEDCGAKEGVSVARARTEGIDVMMSKNIRGRFLAADVSLGRGRALYKRGHLLTKADAHRIQEAEVGAVSVRSPLACKSVAGICQRCYGLDLGKHELVGLGEAVGTVAAQAIGEPGTQLTMRTFHTGGVSSIGGDITQGLPRVEELFEKRSPKNPAVICRADGVVSEIKNTGKEKVIVVIPELSERRSVKKKSESEYTASFNRIPLVKAGERVKKGDLLTDGAADIDDLFTYGGRERAQEYIIAEVTKPYELQGETVARKHIETIVRQMFFRRRVVTSGGTTLSVGDIVDPLTLHLENKAAKERGAEEAKGETLVMGISEVSLSRRSFLSASSFQHTTRVLINAAVRGSRDPLTGLMENVIIGRLIPAGTGFPGGPKHAMIEKLQKELEPEPVGMEERAE